MGQVITDCLYRGERSKQGTAVTVHDSPGEHHALGGEPAPVFDWGRPTAGARDLAAALLTDALGRTPEPALEQRFFLDVVCQLSFIEPWVLWRGELRDWAARSSGN